MFIIIYNSNNQIIIQIYESERSIKIIKNNSSNIM